ncbi:MAG: xylan 1,4-beta-xylosidase [Clostridia bacterium]|nr:xylan 1,4-beta-xylosidase [Clostridia bacterium]
MAKKETRFVCTQKQGGAFDSFEIWVDKKTGVNYIYRQSGYSGGLTPLLDAAGKPIVTPLTPDLGIEG